MSVAARGTIALACALVFGVPAAEAGVYEVRSCATDAMTAYVSANTSPGTIVTAAACPAVAQELVSGLSIEPKAGTSTADGASAAWTVSAPPGLTLRRLDVRRSIGTTRASWKVQVRTGSGAVLESCELDGHLSCRRGDPAGDASASFADLDTRSVSFVMECRLGPMDAGCPGRTTPQAWIAIYSSVALVDDPAPPAIEPLTGPLVAPGWHRGGERIDLAAADASGVRSLSLAAGGTTLYHQPQACDYSRMQPCPASTRQAATVDTSRLGDGTHELRATATDAADQVATATATVRIDGTAPAKPTELAVERNPDGTLAFMWTNPDQGNAAPITGARYEVCSALGVACVPGAPVSGLGIARLDSVAIPGGEHQIRVWLQDEAGNADPANAAVLNVDPSTITSLRVLDTNPPVLSEEPAPSPRLRITRARRSGSTLTLTGTIARGATATISAQLSRTKTGRAVATGRTKPKRGKWSLRLRLTPALRNAGAMYLSVRYAGQASFRKTTLQRRLARKAGRGSEEFSIQARSGRE